MMASKRFHALVLAIGTAFLLIGAFHGNVWFDESYSVGIASHSFAEIWRIGSGDVHPVLFYWALHVLYLVFGTNVLVYRLFAVAGAVALAALGITHIRRLFGWKTGLWFTLLACFTPYLAIMAIEIRMYSWATFAVCLCALSAWEIYLRVRGAGGKGAVERGDAAGTKAAAGEAGAAGIAGDGSAAVAGMAGAAGGEDAAPALPASRGRGRLLAGVPVGLWATFFLSSLASAYLHYFGVLSAFVVNVLLFAYLLYRLRARKGALGVFLGGAVAQVALYAPWLLVLMGQVSVVSNTYWATWCFPPPISSWRPIRS